MARYASRGRQIVVVVDVTIGALPRRHNVRAGQSKVHHGVIEGRGRPANRGVALCAVRGEVRRDVIRIRRALEILQVARNAGSAHQVVIIVDVAVGTLPRRHGVPARQRKSDQRVVELRIQPVIHPVTSVAGSREAGGDVIRVRRCLEIRSVAGITGCGHGMELAVGRSFVARIAVHCRMCSSQREAVVVLLDLLHRDLPAPHRVALLAVGPQLAPVDVSVAILAALTNVGEHGLDVTLNAGYRLVHPAQRITCLIVIEFRDSANRPPSVRCVAVLTRNVQIAVRTMRASGSLRLRASRKPRKAQQQQPN